MSRSRVSFKEPLKWILIIGGVIGFIAAFIIMQEKLAVLNNPAYVPSCSLNPIISCGSVLRSSQAEAFGFSNPLLGIAGFAVIITIGAAMAAGAQFKRWFWLGLQLGSVFGLVFVHWLVFQSLYSIGALCPYCLVVWSVTIPIFWYTTLHNLQAGNIKASKRVGGFLQRHHAEILVLWILLIIGLILQRFWFYWSTLI